MSIGAGIAIAAVWGMVAAAMLSPTVSGAGLLLAMLVAIIATAIIAVS